jgi:hypothetical protein
MSLSVRGGSESRKRRDQSSISNFRHFGYIYFYSLASPMGSFPFTTHSTDYYLWTQPRLPASALHNKANERPLSHHDTPKSTSARKHCLLSKTSHLDLGAFLTAADGSAAAQPHCREICRRMSGCIWRPLEALHGDFSLLLQGDIAR